LWTKKDLQVSNQMADHKDNQPTASNGHDVFLAQRRIPDSRKKIHQVRRTRRMAENLLSVEPPRQRAPAGIRDEPK
ncbi:MAG TPA: hypothetical protein VNT99_14390, partial [Methylomirabilota bacterium]|nr:hypothetical protein [Methylomirabilota bacterium]